MDTRRIWPETIISGFFYLAALACVVAWALGLSDRELKRLFESVAGNDFGLIGLVSAAVFGASYVLGSLAGQLMTDLFQFFGDRCLKKGNKVRVWLDHGMRPDPEQAKQPKQENDLQLARMMSKDVLVETVQARYSTKYFFRSVIGGIAFLALGSAPWWLCSQSLRVSLTVGGMAFVFWSLFVIAFRSQRAAHDRLFQALQEQNQKPPNPPRKG
jgi:hypothetical protein